MPGDEGIPSFDVLNEYLTRVDADDESNADGCPADVLRDAAAATVVGIGEPVHGVRDCHVLQHRVGPDEARPRIR